MESKLYVGGINYNTTDDSLRDAFAQAGEVASAKIITDRMSGRSRGFGFVEMASPEDAQKAIEMWHGKELEGRRLTVNEARPPRERSFGGGGGYGEEAPAEEPGEEAPAEAPKEEAPAEEPPMEEPLEGEEPEEPKADA